MTQPQKQTPTVNQLLEGEIVLATWLPNILLFAQRALLLSFVTAFALSSLGYLTWVQWLVAVPALTVIFLVIFDDINTWFRHRNDAWHLTNQRLIYEKLGEPDENAAVALQSIEWTAPWMWWSLRVGFAGGTSTAMRFLRHPRDIQARIRAAQQALVAAPAGAEPDQKDQTDD